MILGVSLTDARPPSEVEADFAAAQSAESERDRRINEALSYQETTTVAARSAAGAKLEAARGAATRRLITARAEADKFVVLAAQAERVARLTMRRLYIESMQALLDRVKSKLIVPPGGDLDLTVLGLKAELPSPARPRAWLREPLKAIDEHIVGQAFSLTRERVRRTKTVRPKPDLHVLVGSSLACQAEDRLESRTLVCR